MDHVKDMSTAYEAYADAIFRFCFFKLSNRELAKDLTQETFLKTWSYLAGGGEVKGLKVFLYATANHLIIDEYRKKGRQLKVADSLDRLQESGFDPSFDDTDSWIDKLDGQRALELINQLPKLYKDVLFMRYVEDLSLEEIHQLTGESDNTISVRIHRGIEKLRKIINNQ